MTFVTYGLSGHTLNASSVFAGLQYFNVLRQPIAFLPIAFTAVSDAAVAIGRIGEALRVSQTVDSANESRPTSSPKRSQSAPLPPSPSMPKAHSNSTLLFLLPVSPEQACLVDVIGPEPV